MLQPRRTVYWRFLTDDSFDAHFFGGIWAELLGTFYLAIGTMLLAVPMGLIAAIYLTEYARETPFLSFLRTCINTLAGVPSIVFGLFGLARLIGRRCNLAQPDPAGAGRLRRTRHSRTAKLGLLLGLLLDLRLFVRFSLFLDFGLFLDFRLNLRRGRLLNLGFFLGLNCKQVYRRLK